MSVGQELRYFADIPNRQSPHFSYRKIVTVGGCSRQIG